MSVNTYIENIRYGTNYHNTPLMDLVKLISEESDRAALCEFHDHRRLFCFDTHQSLLLAEFVDILCNSRWALALAGHNYNLIEKSYDNLIDRFSNIPSDDHPNGPDCRYYFDAFLASAHKSFRQNGIKSSLEKELLGAKTLQHMVIHHFKYCLRESARDLNPLRTRYQWETNGGTIIVWMPVLLSGSARKTWLQEHIHDPDPANPAEKYRIQQIIDNELGFPAIEDFECCRDTLIQQISHSLPNQEEIDVKGLASAVADEKIENIDCMRPAIKSLGKQKLGDLIRCIFQDISYDNYEEKNISHKFGVSPSTLSRFAGSRWHISAFERCPDLWSNLARVLANNTAFTEAARRYGIWDKVLKTIEIKG
ncbi:MAG: hypothetical protein JXA96_13205 [Sedimentisphaerales bacterium]|nr:hypothetical protein [Sedimentisphaerales bacterium]